MDNCRKWIFFNIYGEWKNNNQHWIRRHFLTWFLKQNVLKYNIQSMPKVQQVNVGVFTQVWTKIFQDLVETQLKPSKLPEFQTLWVYIDHLFLKQFLNLNLNFYLFQVYDFNGQYVFGVLRFCLSLFEDLDSIYHNFLSY
jgi:hypothetical protein